MMRFQVKHHTVYEYSDPVTLCHSQARITPRACATQSVSRWQVVVDPVPAVQRQERDYFGNTMTYFSLQEPHKRLSVMALGEVEVQPRLMPLCSELPWERVRDHVRQCLHPAALWAYQFAFNSPQIAAGPDLADYARQSFEPERPLADAALDLTLRIHRDFKYDPAATTVATPIREVLALRRGVCQDFAHLQIGCLRSLGLPAHYISGYLLTRPAGAEPRLVGADASHAWLAVYCGSESQPEAWIELDPTNKQMPSDRHITAALGRDFSDVSPVRGVISGGGQHTVEVAVEVLPAA